MTDDRRLQSQKDNNASGVSAFERIKHEDETGEYWLARELMVLLGYGSKWQNFQTVIEEAMEVCRVNGGAEAVVNNCTGAGDAANDHEDGK